MWHSGWSTEVNEHMEWVSDAVVKPSSGSCIPASSLIQIWSPGIQRKQPCQGVPGRNKRVANLPAGTYHHLALAAHGSHHFCLSSNTCVQTPKHSGTTHTNVCRLHKYTHQHEPTPAPHDRHVQEIQTSSNRHATYTWWSQAEETTLSYVQAW